MPFLCTVMWVVQSRNMGHACHEFKSVNVNICQWKETALEGGDEKSISHLEASDGKMGGGGGGGEECVCNNLQSFSSVCLTANIT